MARAAVKSRKSAVDDPLRGRIVAEARRQYFAHGFRGVTMDDLAERLGMSKKTLYAAFADKAELLNAVVQDKVRRVEEDLADIVGKAAADPLEALEGMLACLQLHMAEIQPAFLRDLERLAPETFELVKRRRAEVIQKYFGKLLERGRRAGVIRSDVPLPVVMEILLATVQGVMTPPKIAELGLTPKSGISAIISVIFEGLITRKARGKR
jgi:AcrR family transcriptional regulator